MNTFSSPRVPLHLDDRISLASGIGMPPLGLGVFKVEDGQELVDAVKSAIRLGYRSIDTASVYGNEAGVGRGIREALAENGLRREYLFVTSKVWNSDLGYEETLAAYEKSLELLGLDYLDLYLIHWPVDGKYAEAWRALEELYRAGRVKAIGVSNFHVHHLETLMNRAEIVPMVNQIEFHPMLSQPELRDFARKHGIVLEAWSPLMQGGLFEEPLLLELAASYRRTVAQIVLRWDLQHRVITIPKSIREARIAENANVFDFELTEEDMRRIDALNVNRRVGPDPDSFDF
ncbi:aldo/keto reductase [Saccharibacillus sp. O23]|uniref:aldo/keto reductase n=1 Tax=Saccharibacillus sp. O23 TaxID=2009338 RepID=UPI000B4E799E|nr:aldo/keto reductase [Saccharibacillus sp. O23]OWR29007.1 aldo/keto reductase [Saccharibacillus sp. O23]